MDTWKQEIVNGMVRRSACSRKYLDEILELASEESTVLLMLSYDSLSASVRASLMEICGGNSISEENKETLISAGWIDSDCQFYSEKVREFLLRRAKLLGLY